MERSKSFDAIYERLLEASGTKTDSELARVLGISPQSVNGARERGSVPPAWVQSYAEISGVSSDWLFFGRGSMHPCEFPDQQPPRDEPIEVASVQQSTTQPGCPRCAKLEAKLEKLEIRRDILEDENRQLWKENSGLQKKLGEMGSEATALRERLKRISGHDVAVEIA